MKIDELMDFRFKDKKKKTEDDFGAIYLCGEERKLENGETELPGLVQIRGKKYNLEYVDVLFLMKRFCDVKGDWECFRFSDEELSSTGRKCPVDKKKDQFCLDCRRQTILIGPIMKDGEIELENGKAIIAFVRGKGMVRQRAINKYLEELERYPGLPKFYDGGLKDKLAAFTKVVTRVLPGKVKTKYGTKDALTYKVERVLDKETVEKAVSVVEGTFGGLDEFKRRVQKKFGSASTDKVEEKREEVEADISKFDLSDLEI